MNKLLLIVGVIVIMLVGGCSKFQRGIIKVAIDCDEVDCSCNINEYCDEVCDKYEIRNDQNWDRVLFLEKPYCICT